VASGALGPGAEFDAIRGMLDRWGPRAKGIGDDAAILDVPRGDRLVVSVDTAVDRRHFRREWLSAREIGYRAVTAALSDLAAMAARPLGILTAITVPLGLRDVLSDLADGIGDAAGACGAPIVGGNLSGGDELSITTTVLGSCYAPIERRGARPGDRLYVTGRLGAPALAIARLTSGVEPGAVRNRFARPTSRIGEAIWLADAGASAAIDISDGLAADARHLASASGVSIVIDARDIPCFDGADAATAIASGEEYELLVALRGAVDADTFAARFGIPLTLIGSVEPRGSELVEIRGADMPPGAGYDHFSS